MKSANAFQIELIEGALAFHEKNFGKLDCKEKTQFCLDWIKENAKSFRELWDSVTGYIYVEYNKKGLHRRQKAKYDVFQLEEFLDRVNTCNRFPDRIYYNIKIVEV